MTKQFINTVTITGADDSIQPEDIFKLSEEFDFVEWGILLSRSREGTNRYPSYTWLLKLHHLWNEVLHTSRKAGWKVVYDKPAYNETHHATYEFAKK